MEPCARVNGLLPGAVISSGKGEPGRVQVHQNASRVPLSLGHLCETPWGRGRRPVSSQLHRNTEMALAGASFPWAWGLQFLHFYGSIFRELFSHIGWCLHRHFVGSVYIYLMANYLLSLLCAQHTRQSNENGKPNPRVHGWHFCHPPPSAKHCDISHPHGVLTVSKINLRAKAAKRKSLLLSWWRRWVGFSSLRAHTPTSSEGNFLQGPN